MNTILVTGANGQLGTELKELKYLRPSDHFIFADKNKLNITNFSEVAEFIEQYNISVIINCAAYTAVDKAEEDFELSEAINHFAVENLAKLSKKHQIKLIHISTDYVFDGEANKPYLELDSVNPQNVYGKTKLAGELAIQKINPENSVIIRTSWLYSNFGNSFVKTMLRLGVEKKELSVVSDQYGSPTYARDLAKVILGVVSKIANKNVEVYHFSNEGLCSWYDFAKTIFEFSKMDMMVNPIGVSQYPTPAKRPNYSVLNCTKIKKCFSLEIPNWKVSLKECIRNSKRNKHTI